MNKELQAELALVRNVRRLSPKGGLAVCPPRDVRVSQKYGHDAGNWGPTFAVGRKAVGVDPYRRDTLSYQESRNVDRGRARAAKVQKEQARVLLRIQRTQLRAEERAAAERKLVHVVRMGDVD